MSKYITVNIIAMYYLKMFYTAFEILEWKVKTVIKPFSCIEFSPTIIL